WSGNRITNMRFATPTCGAASPMPLRDFMVANRLCPNSTSLGPNSLSSILSQTLDSAGSSQYRSGRMSTVLGILHPCNVDLADGAFDLFVSQDEILVHRQFLNDLPLEIHVQRQSALSVAVEMIAQDREGKLRRAGTAVAPAKACRGMVHDFEARFQIERLAGAVEYDAVNVLDFAVVDDFSGVHIPSVNSIREIGGKWPFLLASIPVGRGIDMSRVYRHLHRFGKEAQDVKQQEKYDSDDSLFPRSAQCLGREDGHRGNNGVWKPPKAHFILHRAVEALTNARHSSASACAQRPSATSPSSIPVTTTTQRSHTSCGLP